MENKNLLTIIAVTLIGVLSVLFVQMKLEPITLGEQVSEEFEELEEVGDKTDDNTTES